MASTRDDMPVLVGPMRPPWVWFEEYPGQMEERIELYLPAGHGKNHLLGRIADGSRGGGNGVALLACDEVQAILISKWDKDFAPMAASTNATRVFWGTAWTSRTLLAREKRAAAAAEAKDGLRRVFVISAEEVAKEVPETDAGESCLSDWARRGEALRADNRRGGRG